MKVLLTKHRESARGEMLLRFLREGAVRAVFSSLQQEHACTYYNVMDIRRRGYKKRDDADGCDYTYCLTTALCALPGVSSSLPPPSPNLLGNPQEWPSSSPRRLLVLR